MTSQDPGLAPGQLTEINVAEATTTNPVLQTVGLMNAKTLGFDLRVLARQVAHTGNSPESSRLIMRILSVHSPPQLRAGRGRWCWETKAPFCHWTPKAVEVSSTYPSQEYAVGSKGFIESHRALMGASIGGVKPID